MIERFRGKLHSFDVLCWKKVNNFINSQRDLRLTTFCIGVSADLFVCIDPIYFILDEK